MKRNLIFGAIGLVLILGGSFALTSGASLQGSLLAFSGCVTFGSAVLAYRKHLSPIVQQCIVMGSLCLGFGTWGILLLNRDHIAQAGISLGIACIMGIVFIGSLRKLNR
jgi:hypothetical protein